MIYIVELIDLVINNYDDDKVLNEVRSKVNELMKGRPLFN
jgi:glycine hydroxymethyltransferase